MTPLAIDLYCGLGGWSDGLIAEGFDVLGFDIEQHVYGEQRYPGQLVLQDVLTLHGSQFRDADLIVASPPCQEYSYMAMPWKRAKQIAAALRGKGEFPEGYTGSRTVEELNALFNACFRIKREACEAVGRDIPLIVENVRGAIPWVGRSRWNFGSFHLWGDVPALMPVTLNRVMKQGIAHRPDGVTNFHGHTKVPSQSGGRTDFGNGVRFTSRDCGVEGAQSGISGTRANGKGGRWFQDGAAQHGSRSSARKAASAMIAKIPLALSRHIARALRPQTDLARAA